MTFGGDTRGARQACLACLAVLRGSGGPAVTRDVSLRSRHAADVEDNVRVRCPYCREWVDLYVDPDTTGVLVEDCAVCCRPWTVQIERDMGKLRVQVSRAQ